MNGSKKYIPKIEGVSELEQTREEFLREKIAECDQRFQSGGSVETLEKIDAERTAHQVELNGILANQAMKSEVVDSAFSLYVGGNDITEGMADDQKEFIELLYDEISVKVSAPYKIELQDKDDAIKALKELVEEKDASTIDARSKAEGAWKENDRLEELLGQYVLKDAKHDEKLGQLILEKEDALSKRDAAYKLSEERLEEIKRLEALVNEYQVAKVHGEVEAQKIIEIESTERTGRLQELAKKFIKGEQIGLYTEVTDVEGNKQVVRNSELEQMDIVDSFQGIELPILENPTVEAEEGTRPDVEESDVVLEGSESVSSSDTDEGETPTTPAAEEDTSAEEAQEAVREETEPDDSVMKVRTWEEWVTESIIGLKNRMSEVDHNITDLRHPIVPSVYPSQGAVIEIEQEVA